MATKFETTMVNGLIYQKRDTNVTLEDGTKEHVGIAYVPAPTVTTYQDYIKAGVLDMELLLKRFISAEAIKEQAKLRNRKSSNKLSETEYNRLFAVYMTPEVLKQIAEEKPKDTQAWIDTYLTQCLIAEQEEQEVQEVMAE